MPKIYSLIPMTKTESTLTSPYKPIPNMQIFSLNTWKPHKQQFQSQNYRTMSSNLMLKVTKLARESIKPSSPTPPHLRNFKLSLLDQLAPSVYAPLLFFYPNDQSSSLQQKSKETTAAYRSEKLKTSLSDFLTQFYPFAGRIKDHSSINCDDRGVDFSETRIDARMEDVLEKPDTSVLKRFLSIDVSSECDDRLVHVQNNTFACGGTAVAVCWSHKIADGGTLSAFMRGWSSAARGLRDKYNVNPDYNIASSIFPPMDSSIASRALKLMGTGNSTVTRRFVFPKSKILALKAMASSDNVRNPTKVEAVSSFIWKCATRASRLNSGGKNLLSIMSQSVNLRRRLDPPLPADTSIGNVVGFYTAQMEQNMELPDLVAKQRRAKLDFSDHIKGLRRGDDAGLKIRELFSVAGSLVRRDDVDFFKFLSICGDGLYDVDFGWGKPVWSSLVSDGFKNTIALSETRDGNGIEAWVTLCEDDMVIFEADPQLLEFVSLNPSAFDVSPSLLRAKM